MSRATIMVPVSETRVVTGIFGELGEDLRHRAVEVDPDDVLVLAACACAPG